MYSWKKSSEKIQRGIPLQNPEKVPLWISAINLRSNFRNSEQFLEIFVEESLEKFIKDYFRDNFLQNWNSWKYFSKNP